MENHAMPVIEAGWVSFLSFISSITVSIGIFAVGYGRMKERVDNTVEDIKEIKADKIPERLAALNTTMERTAKQTDEIHKFIFENCDKRCQK